MLKWITSFFYTKERNSITPNSMAKMPKNTFHNFACMVLPNDDDDVSKQLSLKQRQQLNSYNKYDVNSLEDFYDKYNH